MPRGQKSSQSHLVPRPTGPESSLLQGCTSTGRRNRVNKEEGDKEEWASCHLVFTFLVNRKLHPFAVVPHGGHSGGVGFPHGSLLKRSRRVG